MAVAGESRADGRLRRRVSLGLIRNGRDGFNKWLKRHLGARGTARAAAHGSLRWSGRAVAAAAVASDVGGGSVAGGGGRRRRASEQRERARAARGIEPQR